MWVKCFTGMGARRSVMNDGSHEGVIEVFIADRNNRDSDRMDPEPFIILFFWVREGRKEEREGSRKAGDEERIK